MNCENLYNEFIKPHLGLTRDVSEKVDYLEQAFKDINVKLQRLDDKIDPVIGK